MNNQSNLDSPQSIQAAPCRLNLLTFARFMAAMGVVLFHWAHLVLVRMNGDVAYFVSSGYVYVGFFYVLSGFVMTYSFAGKRLQMGSFLVARIARIYPAYALALLLMIPPFILRIHQGEYSKTRLIASLITVPSLMQAWFPITAQAWNFTAWSVSAEFFFYLTFPYALVKMKSFADSSRSSAAKHIQFILLLWVISLIPTVLYSIIDPDNGLSSKSAELGWLNLLCFCPLFRLPEFLAGISVAFLVLRETGSQRSVPSASLSRPLLLLTIGLGSIILFLAFKPASVSFAILHNGLLLPLWALTIYGLVRLELTSKLFVPGFLVLLGEASYGIYVLQAPISNAFKLLIRITTGKMIKGDYDSPWSLGLFCVSLIAFSILSFKYFETPSRLFIRRVFDRRKSKDLPIMPAADTYSKAHSAGR